jgi:hypothetical protein
MEGSSPAWKKGPVGRAAALFFLLAGVGALPAAARGPGEEALDALRKLPPMAMDEVMWLARCVLSESDRADEQRLVAWVVRNRVETRYRGASYREVVLEPLQFSAFNTPSPRRTYLLSLNQHAEGEGWEQAVAVALDVYRAPSTERPISQETRHFYSPISMKGRTTPPWADRATPLDLSQWNIDPSRFLFFEQIDERLDPFQAARGPAKRIDDFLSETRESLQDTRPERGRVRLQPSGRVLRPTRPGVGATRKVRGG